MFKQELFYYGTHNTGWFLFYTFAIIAALAMIVMLLRYERRLVSRNVGNLLLVMRIAVLLLLFIVWMEPVLSWSVNKEKAGRVLVAIDLSQSMETADKQASPGEKLRWARALGMIGNQKTDARLNQWQRAYDLDKEPIWVGDQEVKNDEQRKQLATLRKKNIAEVFKKVDAVSRKEMVLQLLTKTEASLLNQLEESVEVQIVAFAGGAETVDAEALSRTFATPPEGLTVDLSDLTAAMNEQTASSEKSQLLGVVLLTDGRDNSKHDALRMAEQLGNANIPVYPVLFGSEHQPRDISIGSLGYDSMPRKDDRAVLKVQLNTSGYEGEELSVTLEKENEEPIVKTVKPTGPIVKLEFDLYTKTKGRREYSIHTDVLNGETREDNNRKEFAYTVVDDTIRVLLIEGEARWEFRYLHNALKRDKQVEVKEVVFDQPFLGLLPETFFKRKLTWPTNAVDLANSPFAEQDIIIIGDIAPDKIPEQGWLLLEKFVSETGGTVVFVAGKQHFPLKYQSPIIDRLLPMTNLKPVALSDENSVGSPAERGFHLKLTHEGEQETMFHFSQDRAENRSIWEKLPGHTWGIQGTAKPGATVFATTLLPGQEESLETERNTAIIAKQNYGLGQVLWMGIDSTWRWRFRMGDTYHHRFWGQLGRWAAMNKAVSGNENVRFGPQKTDLEVGDDAVFEARWVQQFLNRHANLKAKVNIEKISESAQPELFATLELHPSESNPLLFQGRQVALPAGEYRATLVAEEAEIGGDFTAPLYVNPRKTIELGELSANKALLTQIAEVSHGQLFLPDEVEKIPELFENPDLKTTLREERTLWDHWLMMLLFFGILSTEWIIRKLNGLP